MQFLLLALILQRGYQIQDKIETEQSDIMELQYLNSNFHIFCEQCGLNTNIIQAVLLVIVVSTVTPFKHIIHLQNMTSISCLISVSDFL